MLHQISPDPPVRVGGVSVACNENALLTREDRDCDVSIILTRRGTS
jgi:hypothetical protein